MQFAICKVGCQTNIMLVHYTFSLRNLATETVNNIQKQQTSSVFFSGDSKFLFVFNFFYCFTHNQAAKLMKVNTILYFNWHQRQIIHPPKKMAATTSVVLEPTSEDTVKPCKLVLIRYSNKSNRITEIWKMRHDSLGDDVLCTINWF